ncbi:MAG: hypothetical protein PHC30_09370, partial [Lentisphaeria bacterium]|nr:hypothetical protein [Lentisphaeria bacterium]
MMLIRNASALLVPGRRTAMAMASLLLATTVFVPTMERYCRNYSEFTFRLTHILPGVLLGW